MNFIEYIKEELQEISMMEYSTEYSDEAKNISVGSNNILDSETHSKMSEIDFAGNFSDKETLIKWYFSYLSNMKKLGAVSQLGQFIKDNDVKSVISFGAGPCVLEYFASLITGGGGVQDTR